MLDTQQKTDSKQTYQLNTKSAPDGLIRLIDFNFGFDDCFFYLEPSKLAHYSIVTGLWTSKTIYAPTKYFSKAKQA